MHKGSFNRRKVGCNNSQLSVHPLPIGLDQSHVLILNGVACSTMCWATAAVRAL